MTRTEERGHAILTIFAEAQRLAHDITGEKVGNLLESVRRRKALDNAEQGKNRQCNPAKRAARAAGKRAARGGALIKPRCTSDAERLARRRARQRKYVNEKRKAA